MTGFIFSGSKITADGHWRHEIKKTLAPWKKSCDKPRQCIKKQRHYFSDKGLSSQSYGFLVVMYGCDSWIIKKAEHQRIDAFELWCWRRLFESPLDCKEIKPVNIEENQPEYSLKRLMLKLQYFGHLMWRVDAVKDWGQERKGMAVHLSYL